MIGLVGCTESATVIDWIPRRLLCRVVRTQTLRSTVWFGGEDADPMQLGEEQISLLRVRYLSLPPTRQDLILGQWHEGRFIVGIILDIGSLSTMWVCCWIKLVIISLNGMWAWWALLDIDSNVSSGTDAILYLKLDRKVKNYTILVYDIITHLNVA